MQAQTRAIPRPRDAGGVAGRLLARLFLTCTIFTAKALSEVTDSLTTERTKFSAILHLLDGDKEGDRVGLRAARLSMSTVMSVTPQPQPDVGLCGPARASAVFTAAKAQSSTIIGQSMIVH